MWKLCSACFQTHLNGWKFPLLLSTVWSPLIQRSHMLLYSYSNFDFLVAQNTNDSWQSVWDGSRSTVIYTTSSLSLDCNLSFDSSAMIKLLERLHAKWVMSAAKTTLERKQLRINLQLSWGGTKSQILHRIEKPITRHVFQKSTLWGNQIESEFISINLFDSSILGTKWRAYNWQPKVPGPWNLASLQ